MGGARRFFFFFLPIIAAHDAHAGLVVNELYYDHPGADGGYEFVELLNTGDASFSLDGVVLEFHNGSGEGWTVLWSAPPGLALEPGALWVLGGDLVLPAPDLVVGISLQNGPDAVRLARGAEIFDVVGYGGLDDPNYVEAHAVAVVPAGKSIARTPDGRDSGDNALDFVAAAPSPGRRNVALHDVAILLSPETPSRSAARTRTELLAIEIENRGLADIPAGGVVIAWRDSSEGGIADGPAANNRYALLPGAHETLAITVSLAGDGYHWIDIAARYAPDERAHNDRVVVLRRVGSPPLLVSEVLSSPSPGCPQFVELFNAGARHLDITRYAIRDTRLKLAVIAADSLVLAPREFVILTPSPDVLMACVNVTGRIFEVDGSWPTFNKSGGTFADSVVVMDALEIPVDAVAYPGLKTNQAGFSLDRIDLFAGEVPRAAVWSLSRARGGTPGRMSESSLSAPPRASCEVSPNPFFADEGDLLRVAIAPVEGVASVAVRIYDPSGKRIADVGTASAFPAVLLWDGRAAGGERVRSGILVLTCESFSSDGARVGVEKVVVGCANRSP